VFFLGDLFHQRTAIEVTSLNVANDLVRRLASTCEVFLLQGNHDLYEKYNSVITSLNIFELDNVNIISVPTEVKLNGQKVLLVPWLCGTTLDDHITRNKLSDDYDIMMGHFDISYSGDIRNKGQNYAKAYKTGGKNFSDVDTENIVSEILHHTHDYSTIYMGHIHDHETLTFENRTWNIVGSPQYQVHDMKRLPDEKKQHGYFILDEKNKETFCQCASVPKFVTVYASDMVNGTLDESKLKGSIIRRCYDVVLTDEQKGKLDNIVSDAGVYEEDSSVFVLGISNEDSTDETSEEDMGIVVDKFDYIQGQIDKINHEAIDNRKLSEMMKEYYADYLRIVLVAYDDELQFYQSCGFKKAEDASAMFITSLWT
jgi:DNA repair exonuclease SbcCD nuclease subunit